jgi:hypothetical protein
LSQNILTEAIYLSSNYLYVGSYHISLHGRRRTLELLKHLMLHSDGLYHEDLRERMFGRTSQNKRILKTQDSSLRKLIARTRTIVTSALAHTEWTDKIQWFVYRDQDETWNLFHSSEGREGEYFLVKSKEW